MVNAISNIINTISLKVLEILQIPIVGIIIFFISLFIILYAVKKIARKEKWNQIKNSL